ncbi:hypothetical protein VBD025_08755 [Virgibacillus flavescens]|uniref:hypothetical protein n=1 Tax=Virgibacillus flavescens TaxID=1611422 RepID=UPI003D34EECA
MQDNRQSSVVDTTLRELMNSNREGTEKAHRKTVLVLLFYHMNGMDLGLSVLKKLQETTDARIIICPDEQILAYASVTSLAESVGLDDFISLEELELKKEKIDYVYIPILPFSVVSDLINFNDTRQSIRLLIWALMSGKKVSAFSAGADPYHAIWQESEMNQGTAFLKQEMKKKLQLLRGFGIDLIERADDVSTHYISAFNKEKTKVITADKMKKYAATGRNSFTCVKGTIITPLARDVARKYHIKIDEK